MRIARQAFVHSHHKDFACLVFRGKLVWGVQRVGLADRVDWVMPARGNNDDGLREGARAQSG
jgi:hypothetical protein